MKGLDIQSPLNACASFYILIMVFLPFDDFNISRCPSVKHDAWTVTAVIGLVVLNICAFLVECSINQI